MSSLALLVCFTSLVLSGADDTPNVTEEPARPRFGGAIEVRHFDFEQAEDADYDKIPDDWSRVKGPGFPHYITAEIDPAVGDSGKRSLRFDADGGNVTFFSPPLPIDFRQSYVLQGTLRTRGLDNDWATISLTFLDSLQRPVAQVDSRRASGTGDWTAIQLGPIVPSDPEARFLVVGCHLRHGRRLDLGGAVWFDDLWIGRLPRMVLSFLEGEHFFATLDRPVVRCLLSGFERKDLSVELTLSDVFGQRVDDRSFHVDTAEQKASAPRTPKDPFTPFKNKEEELDWEPTEIRWDIPPQPAGFYRVTATLRRGTIPLLVDHLTLAVISPSPARPTGEFGWSLERIPPDVKLADLADLAARARINWLKYPLWSLEGDSAPSSEEFVQFIEALDRYGIALVGLLNDPPDQVRKYLTGKQTGASDVFRLSPSRWYPSLEPILANYSMKIKNWQLGGEGDRSFVDVEGLSAMLRNVKVQLDRVGRDVHLGVSWDWMYPEPESAADQLAFVSLSSRPALTDRELAAHLADRGSIPRWIALSPLPAGPYSISTRASDLVRRMIAAKRAGAGAIFATDLFDSQRGFVNKDGSPTELFLPWRNVSDALSGAQYLGSLVLPSGSSNDVFLRDRQLILAVWNDQATREELYLGRRRVLAVDVWGRRQNVSTERKRHTLEVGPLPVFLFGADENVARWRLATAFTNGKVPSQVGRHQETVRFRNTFSQGVFGLATLVLPEGWTAEPLSWEFQLAPKETLEQKVLIGLPFNASQGRELLAIDFDLNADRTHRFRVYRPYELGLGDVELEVLSNLTPDGEIEIEQRITNDTDEILTFECILEAPRRKRKKTMVIKLGRGRDIKFYLLPNGEELLGKTLSLRAKQIGGRRILNRQFVVGE